MKNQSNQGALAGGAAKMAIRQTNACMIAVQSVAAAVARRMVSHVSI